MRGPIFRFLSLFFLFAVFFRIQASYAAMPSPTGQQAYAYPPTSDPVVSPEPSEAKPMGVGPIAVGGNVLDFAVHLDSFQAPVDVYLALDAPALGSGALYLLTGENRLQPLSASFGNRAT